MATVSVIMNCYNSDAYLREAIESVYAQTFKDWEIIFWDNASTDKSAEIAKSYDDRLKYFRGERTVPLGNARNLALAKASGQYIAFLDCDDLWLSTKLEKQIVLFEKKRHVGLVYCDTIFFKASGDLYNVFSRERPYRGMVFRNLLSRYFLSMETVVIRKEALDALDHWFDDTLAMAEEMDLFLRIAHDWELDFVDEPLAKWRMHEKSESHEKLYMVPKEKEIILAKLAKIYPEFTQRYGVEISGQRRMIAYHWALASWKDGEAKKARSYLHPYVLKETKTFIAYVMSIFPYGFYKSAKNIFLSLRSSCRP